MYAHFQRSPALGIHLSIPVFWVFSLSQDQLDCPSGYSIDSLSLLLNPCSLHIFTLHFLKILFTPFLNILSFCACIGPCLWLACLQNHVLFACLHILLCYSHMVCFSAKMVEATGFSEKSLNLYQTAWCYILEDSIRPSL